MSTLTTTSTLAPARPVEVRPLPPSALPPLGPARSGAPVAWWRAAAPRRPWLWLAAFVVACGWDRAAWLFAGRSVAPVTEAIEAVSLRSALASTMSWRTGDALGSLAYFGYHAVKSFGTVWLSAAVAAAIILRTLVQPDTVRVRVALRRGVLLFLATAAAGLIAELFKLVFRRQRPEFADGHYSFRFGDFWSASGLGLPSSHAAVAAAAAIVLCLLWPRQRLLWIAVGLLCILSRVFSGAHFVSDAVLGTFVGLAAARAVIALDLRNNRGVPVPA